MIRIISGLLAMALLPALWPTDAMAEHCTEEATNLIAGRHIESSDVNVCNDGTTLTITYEVTYPWCLLETNLHVVGVDILPPDDPDIQPIVVDPEINIPQNKRGIPIPGQFDQGDEHGCEGVATFEIPLDDIGEDGVEPGDTVVIAAHAEVRDTETLEEKVAWGDGVRFVQRGPRATYFTYEVQVP
jgi:hypothetical protein